MAEEQAIQSHAQLGAPGSHRPRYASLDDYLQVVRRRRWIIVAVVLIGAVAGAASSLSREDNYTATASLSFRDITQDLSLFGIDALPEEPPAIRAAVNAELVTRPQVTRRVARDFEGELTPAQLAAAVDARVGARTQLVVLEATADDPELAARVANGYAEAAAAIGDRQSDGRLRQVERSLLRELESLESGPSAQRPGVGVRISILEQQLSRVQTLRDIAEPVVIAQEAVPPSAPDTPNPAISGLIGGLIGLVLGLIAAFTRDALDRRVRSANDVHHELGLPVLGRVLESSLGTPGLAAPNGRAPMPDAEFEAFRMLRTNLGFLMPDDELRCVLVASAGPGEGKSTVSMSLASAAAIGGSRVLLVEGDLRRPCFADRLGIPATPGLVDYLRGSADPADVLKLVDLRPPVPSNGFAGGGLSASAARLVCIPAGSASPRDAAELLGGERFRTFVREVRTAYDLIVIDSSPLLAVVDPLQLAEQVDAVLICARANQTTRDELRAARSALANLPERPCGAVATGLRRDGPDGYGYYYGY
jgi:Mrp family chromosome partitioning ATPase/capsular polysaccharide biosynthesis protein